ncbi:hypothetical protein [uncultured Aquimarina sp.]|uniref:hypothetical protein n=1 Tax=uncultured Aquimarina sp. TaxID=575652 RepID=UPI0026243664|nr:hypothetical protein [uncultured Aquimarina sp.]
MSFWKMLLLDFNLDNDQILDEINESGKEWIRERIGADVRQLILDFYEKKDS